MKHPLDHAVASDLSYRVFQLRRERGELGTGLSDTNHQVFNVPSLIVNRRKFVADPDCGQPDHGDAAHPKGNPEPTPIDPDLRKRQL